MAKELCIIGGGASGVGLAWILARAGQLGLSQEEWKITIIHDQKQLGGHSLSHQVQFKGSPVNIDLGVQMIAAKVYPLIMSLLKQPEFKDTELQYMPLKISAAWPPDTEPAIWGNFPEYQNTALWQSGAHDCKAFEGLMEAALVLETKELTDTLDVFLDKNSFLFDDLASFKKYFLGAYLMIMNGYGNPRIDQTQVLDLLPLFDLGYASFTKEVTGYARFKDGAMAWVQSMSDMAKAHFGPDNYVVQLESTVAGLWPSPAGPTVQWSVGQAAPVKTFDYVVSTVSMEANAKFLSVTSNADWDFYKKYVGCYPLKGDGPWTEGYEGWPLMAGACYLHRDHTMLAPGTQKNPLETLQMTACYSDDEANSYTTFVSKNLMGIDDPDFDYLVTMYGSDPLVERAKGRDIKVPKDPIVGPIWVHGMWLPTFMLAQKMAMADAQSVSPHWSANSTQKDNKIWFAGNNLTMDSEEGAFASAMAVAQYAFGVDSAACVLNHLDFEAAAGLAEYLFFFELMFRMGDETPDHAQKGYRRVVEQLSLLAKLRG